MDAVVNGPAAGGPKAKLPQVRDTAPLFDTERFARP
jgi:hypothetical protein